MSGQVPFPRKNIAPFRKKEFWDFFRIRPFTNLNIPTNKAQKSEEIYKVGESVKILKKEKLSDL
jgi:hypothetical protein